MSTVIEPSTGAATREAGAVAGPETAQSSIWSSLRGLVAALSRGGSRAAVVAGEAVFGVAAAAMSLELSTTIHVDPLDRVGQVSGLAGLGLHLTVLGLSVLVLVGAVSRWAPGAAAAVARAWGAAAVAGLVTGFVGGGLVVALSGTTWPLFADSGDAGQINAWVGGLLRGVEAPSDYPPLALQGMAWWSGATGDVPTSAVRVFEIGGAALYGPAAYLAWRLVLRPSWALVMTLVAAVPLMDLYKPYANLVLVVLVPVLIRVLLAVRHSPRRSWVGLVLTGLGWGVLVGLLFLTYSGWFVWSAPGALVALALAVPWRRGAARGLALLGAALAAFVLVAHRHLLGLLGAAGTVQDRFFYFDTFTEPAYIAMWRNDTPGDVGPWPPPGELGGMGVFSALLVAGLAVALLLGRRRVDVSTLALVLAGAWVVRFWIASRMYGTGSVQLYPRTTVEILYCLLALGVLAAMLGVARLRPAVLRAARRSGRTGGVGVAILAPALLAGLFMASATVDRYMPSPDGSAGYLAFVAHHVRQPDGRCSPWVRPDQCLPNAALVEALRTVPPGQPPPPAPIGAGAN